MKTLLSILLLLGFAVTSLSQSKEDKEKAYKMGLEAIQKMDNGEIDESIKLLKESQKLDPENYLYPYEIGYAYFLDKNYKKAIKTLHNVIEYAENNDQCYTLLGNVYDIDGQPETAIEIYKEGLAKFPNSGRLYYEQGNVMEVLEEYDNALASWESGIGVSPSYPSNYYTAAIYYSKYTSESIWGILYGELFVNIERGSKKTETISKLLFDTYQSAISITSDTSASVGFSNSMQMTMPVDGQEFKLPFSMPFEITMAMSIPTELNEKELGIKSFHNIRSAFIKNWFESGHDKDYSNIVFDWHKKLIDLGHFESYNYWLLMKGNEEEFNQWAENNTEAFEAFIEWFSKNPLIIDAQHNFHRLQYN